MSYYVSCQRGGEWALTQLIWQASVMLLTSPPPIPFRFSTAAHMVNKHAQYSWSDSLIHSSYCPSFPVYLLLLRSVCLSLSASLFKALLYSFHSLSITLEANSLSQWAWVNQDKYDIIYNACKLHTYRCTRHVWGSMCIWHWYILRK